jgi:DNA-binding winged helix-turn-helix (wHTH) protein
MSPIVHFARFLLNTESRELRSDNTPIHLTPKAFDLLALLVSEAPRVVPKAELHQRMWPDTFVSDATLVGLIKEVRKALHDEKSGTLIRTAHRVGYACAVEVHCNPRSKPSATRWLVVGGRRITLEDGVHVIGRDPGSDVWLDVAGVSRQHARLVVHQRRTTIEDLGSKNGTLLGDDPVTTPVELRDSDRIDLGSTVLVFRESATSLSTETVKRHAARPVRKQSSRKAVG